MKCAIPIAVALLFALPDAASGAAANYLDRLPEDEIVYFLLPDRFENGDASNDRGGLQGDRLDTGFDPTAKGFFHGGDLKGLLTRLDYIQGLGATAIWLGPIYKNKPVQGPPGDESAGYHGYWITDFTTVDPHFGTDADLQSLVSAVHARGMKVYLDIITNHTADVIAYRECPTSTCLYRSRADYPYSARGGVDGQRINLGFAGDDAAHQSRENFARLTHPDFAYTPYIPAGSEHTKVPAWLNDPIYYHNRGNSTFNGESSDMGDFVGLDDLMTENPRVVQGFIDIYGTWIDRFRVDGFRIDTAKHVNPEFWQAFVPAMRARAAAHGIKNFHIFGEIGMTEMDTALLALHTRVHKLPSVLDFAFRIGVGKTLAGNAGTSLLARLYLDDALYQGGSKAAVRLPTFVSNHDDGRFASAARKAFPGATDEQILERVVLAHAMLFTLRGVPVVYAGDEQGFAGLGGDQAARQDMFASQVASYNNDPLVGSTATTAASNFNSGQPLYRAIAELAALRSHHAALRRGAQVVRSYSDTPGLFAVSRLDPASGRELVVAFNTSTAPLTRQMQIEYRSVHFTALHGSCAPDATAPGSYRITLAPLSFAVCAAEARE